ncbi:MAG: nucleoside-diphosphate kinase [Candidatus Thermoplasmatota archaeon]
MDRIEQTLVLLKPDALQRSLIGDIISIFEKKGLKITGMKLMNLSKEKAEKNYEEHKGKEFYNELLDYITSSPVIAMVIEGRNAIAMVREIIGATDPLKATPSTIRGKYGLSIQKNLVHGSANLESAKREIKLFFKDDEIIKYERIDEKWL